MSWFKSRKKEILSSVEASIRDAKSPVLRILLGDDHIATLFHDGESYCLAYRENFNASGLIPFHETELKNFTTPEVDRLYRSKDLWPVFEARIPSPDRDDYNLLLKSHRLIGNEHPLEILGKIGAVSISKPWRLEISNPPKKAS